LLLSFTLFKENNSPSPLLLGFWLVRGSALGPICGLSARQLNSCLPRREESGVTLKTGLRFVQGHSLEVAPFDRSYSSSYSPSIWRYFVSFARYSDLLVENREIFIPHLYLAPSSEFCKNV